MNLYRAASASPEAPSEIIMFGASGDRAAIEYTDVLFPGYVPVFLAKWDGHKFIPLDTRMVSTGNGHEQDRVLRFGGEGA